MNSEEFVKAVRVLPDPRKLPPEDAQDALVVLVNMARNVRPEPPGPSDRPHVGYRLEKISVPEPREVG